MDQSLRKTRRRTELEVNRAKLTGTFRNCPTSMVPLGIHGRQLFAGPPKVLCQGRAQSLDCGLCIGLVKNRSADGDSVQAGFTHFGDVSGIDAADGKGGQ